MAHKISSCFHIFYTAKCCQQRYIRLKKPLLPQKGTKELVSYNVAVRRLCAAIVVVEKQYALHIFLRVCSVSYPTFNVHAPYCHLWPVQL